ncbi:MAG: serine hydrolase [Salinimicrobium sp.]
MKKILTYTFVIVFFAIAVALYIYYPRLDLITGFASKNMCSCTFVAEREPETVSAQDNGFSPVSWAQSKILDSKAAVSKVLGIKVRKSTFQKGIGCTLLPEDAGRDQRVTYLPNRSTANYSVAYPYGTGKAKDSVFESIDYSRLSLAINAAFAPANQTRAVVVLYKDHLIGEHYAPGFSAEVRQQGWSMTKSITSAVIGILRKQGKISLEQDHLFPEWEDDARNRITLNDLLHMNSGLEWDEDYSRISDVTKMLFLADDMSQVQLHKPLVGEPGSTWNYSSGTSNLLSGFIRKQFASHQEYLNFWYEELIDKIGMNSMVIETDLAGNYVGSSYSWATPRDWAKFGLLYLHLGNWKGEQIIEESWVDYTTKPTKGSEGQYGAHFWLNSGGKFPGVPRDMFSANGFQGQYVFVIPSKDLVVVRTGLVEDPEFDVNIFLKEILEAIEPEKFKREELILGLR